MSHQATRIGPYQTGAGQGGDTATRATIPSLTKMGELATVLHGTHDTGLTQDSDEGGHHAELTHLDGDFT